MRALLCASCGRPNAQEDVDNSHPLLCAEDCRTELHRGTRYADLGTAPRDIHRHLRRCAVVRGGFTPVRPPVSPAASAP